MAASSTSSFSKPSASRASMVSPMAPSARPDENSISTYHGCGSAIGSALPGLCFSANSSERREISSKRSEEHTSELQSLMRISYAVFCLKNKQIRTSDASTSLSNITTNPQHQHTAHNRTHDN